MASDNIGMREVADRPWPDVVFRGNAMHAAGLDETDVANLCRHLTEDLFQKPLPLVGKVVVADSDLYGAAIREELGTRLSEGEATHTESQQYVGIAKTLPVYHDDGTVNNTIILRAGVVAAALNKNDIEPTMEVYLGKYIIQHELAHCWDHAARKQPSPVGLIGDEFSITRIGTYYKHILMAEFIACVLSGARLDDVAFNSLCRMDADPLEEQIHTVLNMRADHESGVPSDLRNVAFASAQCAWIVLVQYAKVFGHMFGGSRTTANISVPATLNEYPDAVMVIQNLSQFLGTTLADYPNWPDDGWSELDVLWDRLTRSLGFRFEATPDGSALWFN